MSRKPKGKMFPKTAAMHAYRLFSLGRISGPDQLSGQMTLPIEAPAHTGPRQLPYTLYAVADPDGVVQVPLSELAIMVGKAPRTVERWRDTIRDLGFVVRVASGNRYVSATYLLTVPDWAAEQMTQRYPDTFTRPSTDDTQGGTSRTERPAPTDDTQGGTSRTGAEILETTSQRLETTSPRGKCRLTDKGEGFADANHPPNPPRQRVPSVAAPNGAGVTDSGPDDFTAFWATAVRKTGKGTAARAWRRALNSTSPDVVMAAWRQANTAWATWPDKTKVPHPATWLNGQRWEDEPVQPYPGATATPVGNKWADAMDLLPGDQPQSPAAIESVP